MFTSPMTEEPQIKARPEQTFFADPALDRVFAVVMGLATEVSVLKSRLIAVEAKLNESGIVMDWDNYASQPTLIEKLNSEHEEFIQYLLDPLLGKQKSRGAVRQQGEVNE